MILSIKRGADPAIVHRELVRRGLWIEAIERDRAGAAVHYVIASHSSAVNVDDLLAIDGVERVTTSKAAYPRVAEQGPVVDVGGVAIGAGAPVVIAGPCSVESEENVRGIARALAKGGVKLLRGGAFKPRTSPYAFQGHGAVALTWMRRAADEHGMKMVTEALSEETAGAVAEVADLVQIGSRNMHNYALLKCVGKTGKPVLLKRGMAATIEEWLAAGEYLLSSGARGVVFCERGVRSFDPATRNLLDLGAVALLAHVHRLPVVVDPSHGAGRRDLIAALSRAAIAAGAAGVMIETHDDPGSALSDGPQAIPLSEMSALLADLFSVRRAGGES